MSDEHRDEYDVLLEGLWDDFNAAEEAMYARFRAERSAFERWKEKYPIFVIADFLYELRSNFSGENAELVDDYYGYWSLRRRKKSLRIINKSLTNNYFISSLQFLASPGAWKTRQDPVFFYLCFDLRQLGLSSEVLRVAMKSATAAR